MDPEMDKVVFDTIFFDNGDYYEGQVLDRIPHGEGTMYYESGETIAGKWIYGENVKGKYDDRVPRSNSRRDRYDINNHTLYVGYGYSKEVLVNTFQISGFIRGIRTHHDFIVLLSMDKSIYRDGKGWEIDEDGDQVFVYTGEGKKGDQTMTHGNLALKNSMFKRVFLFVSRKTNEYVFHGQVLVKKIETSIEPDDTGNNRKVFKFILSRM